LILNSSFFSGFSGGACWGAGWALG